MFIQIGISKSHERADQYRCVQATATLAGTGQPKPIPTDNRYDQDPIHFSNYLRYGDVKH